ncbi:MAG: TMEM175 family protein [Acidimicrobiia bacterium]|nr:TMEM175 family protein [Acidimicrobiia bacterium]
MGAGQDLELKRLTYFSDAVFAIAMTLLAVDLRLADDLSTETVGSAMVDLVPTFAAFTLSFAVVGIYWIAHHRMFRYIVRWDGKLLVVNLVFLFFIALQPATTSALGRHGDLAIPTILYSLGIFATGLSSTGIWVHAVRASLVDSSLSKSQIRYLLLRGLVAPAVFGLSIPIAAISPISAQIIWTTVFPFLWILARRYHTALDL